MRIAPPISRRVSTATALFLAAFYVTASLRWFVPGLCIGMCAPLPAGDAPAMRAVMACCVHTAADTRESGAPPTHSGERQCAFCMLLTAPGAVATAPVLYTPAPIETPVPLLRERLAHLPQWHAPGMPRDPPARLATL